MSYRVRSRGNLTNNRSSLAFSSSDRSCGLRRNSHISDRNSFRSAFDSLALYARVIFFSLAVDGLIELLGAMSASHHRLGVAQQPMQGIVDCLRHVRTVRLCRAALPAAHFFDAS